MAAGLSAGCTYCCSEAGQSSSCLFGSLRTHPEKHNNCFLSDQLFESGQKGLCKNQRQHNRTKGMGERKRKGHPTVDKHWMSSAVCEVWYFKFKCSNKEKLQQWQWNGSFSNNNNETKTQRTPNTVSFHLWVACHGEWLFNSLVSLSCNKALPTAFTGWIYSERD